MTDFFEINSQSLEDKQVGTLRIKQLRQIQFVLEHVGHNNVVSTLCEGSATAMSFVSSQRR